MKVMIGMCPKHDIVKVESSYSPLDGLCFRCAICGHRIERGTWRDIAEEEFDKEYGKEWDNKNI